MKKIRRGYNQDVGCFVCRKPGGCKDDGYEDMDENEIQCFCKTKNCNQKCEIAMCKSTEKSSLTDVEICHDGCADLGGNGMGNNENGNKTNGTAAGGANVHKLTQLGLICLMFVATTCLFHPF